MAKNAIESEFLTFKNGRSIWNGQKCNQKWFSNIQNVFVKKFKKIKFRIDLKWPEMRSKVNFLHPILIWPTAARPVCQKFPIKIKLRIDLKWPEMQSKVNLWHPKFCKKIQKIIPYLSKMARNAIESEFQTSKMGAGGHFVKKGTFTKKLSKWFEQCSNRLLAEYSLI